MEVALTKEELALAFEWGTRRASIMAQKTNKAGYAPGTRKTGFKHTPLQAEALAIAAEIAGCKLLGVDYKNPSVYVPVVELDTDGKLPPQCKRPDVCGIWEVRRAETANFPIRIWKKDRDAFAHVLQAVVEHDHVDGRVIPTGRVTFIGWADAFKDYDRLKKASGVAERYLKNPMKTLPVFIKDVAFTKVMPV